LSATCNLLTLLLLLLLLLLLPFRAVHPPPQSAVFGGWYPIFLITLFNVCDLTGKCVPFGSFAPAPRLLLAASISRVVFIPAFYLAGRYAGSWVALMALLTVALGLSNG
jgi:equilibrative nucleoside transporter 1/2/3